MSLRLFGVLAALLAAFANAQFPKPLGSWSGFVPVNCGGNGLANGAVCHKMTIICPNTKDIVVTMGVITPAGPSSGTIAMHGGGGGTADGRTGEVGAGTHQRRGTGGERFGFAIALTEEGGL